MRAGGHRRAQIEARIGRLLRSILRGDRVLRSVSRRRRQREHLQPHAIDADLDLVRLGQSLDELIAVARQAELEPVFPISREVMPNVRPSSRSERLAVKVVFLREIGRKHDGFRAGRAWRHPDRKAADFLRGPQVPLE